MIKIKILAVLTFQILLIYICVYRIINEIIKRLYFVLTCLFISDTLNMNNHSYLIKQIQKRGKYHEQSIYCGC